MARARSKAWISATQQIPSAEHLQRMNFVSPPVEKGFVLCSPEAGFPGAGGMPILDGDEVVGGIAAPARPSARSSAGRRAGADDRRRGPANPEDLLIDYALACPTSGSTATTLSAGRAPRPFLDDAPTGMGMAEAPRAARQQELAQAIRLADAVMAEPERRGALVAVAVVDRRGDPIQQDGMDGCPPPPGSSRRRSPRRPRRRAAERGGRRAHPQAMLDRLPPYATATIAGGVPVVRDGRVVGGLGVGGPDPALAAEIAVAALEATA